MLYSDERCIFSQFVAFFIRSKSHNPFGALLTTKYMETIAETVFTNTSDEFLIQQFKDGNEDAFDLLYFRHLPVVYKRVCWLIPAEDVEDVTQEIFIAASESLPSFRGESQFGTWLRTLTNHKIAEFYRKRNRKQEPLQVAITEASGQSDGNTSKNIEDRITIQRALSALPDNYREIILLRLAEDMSFHEIAKILEHNLEATKSLFRRAISALRNKLGEYL